MIDIPNDERTRLDQFIEGIQPGWKLDDWLHWPPDTFALTSIFLGDSGTHRYSVSPPFNIEDWPRADWGKTSRRLALSWRRELAGLQPDSEAAEKAQGELRSLFDDYSRLCPQVTVHDLYSASKLETRETEWQACKTFIELHAVADQACEGFGLHRTWAEQQALMRLHLIANLLLTSRGTLSRLPKSKGIVLPKMRTPQVGLTLRSLAHHVTFHRTEVDVVWRAAPWLNRDEDTVNIMVVPWPYEVAATYFKPVLHPGASQRLGTARYFAYSREAPGLRDPDKTPRKFDPSDVIRLIRQASKEVNRIHLLVFPETALSEGELRALKTSLAHSFKSERDRIPIVISGIADPTAKNSSKTSDRDLGRKPAFGADHSNKVSLSVFYGEKWYELSQDKHHRWRLDGNQIRQYKLGGVLTGGKLWWEAINIPKRRLSFLAPNAWLTLCPLICEDLARLEPVSELIRGVGPTLLIAILLDGPQLIQRWPGRYASVLADDPGSSVLTVTSLGLSQRSIRRDSCTDDRSRVVALWKDQLAGWQEIELPEHAEAVVLTVSATWHEEYTSDGRGDKENAAVFKLQGKFGVPLHPEGDAKGDAAVGQGEVDLEHPDVMQKQTRNLFSQGNDLIELTLLTYFVNAVLDAESADLSREFLRWIGGQDDEPDASNRSPSPLDQLAPLIGRGLIAYKRDYFDDDDGEFETPSPELKYAVKLVSEMIEEANGMPSDALPEARAGEKIQRWKLLVESATSRLGVIHRLLRAGRLREIAKDAPEGVRDPVRIHISVPPSILWAVHHRLANSRRRGDLSPAGARLLRRIEGSLDKYELPEGETYRAIFSPKSAL